MENGSQRNLRAEVERLQSRLAEVEATLEAIHKGEVDAVVVEGPQGAQVFTLESPEEPYRILAERMNEGAATLTTEGTILFCNRRLAEMAGLPAERLLGSPFISILCDEERPGFPELVQATLKNGVRTKGHLLRSNGTTLPVQLSLTSIPLEESVQGVCLVATDLSDQKRIEDEVRRLNVELEEQVARRTAELQTANKELEAFNYSVAHDLRAPLRHIHGFSDLLMRDAQSTLSDDGRHFLDCILEGTSRAGTLIEALLSLSRIGRQPLSLRRIPLGKVAQEVIDDLARENANRQIEWKAGDLPVVACDPGLMRIVFVNLLGNAVKFTRPRATAIIEIGHKLLHGDPVLFVRDNGVGFDMRYVDKLFGMFQRLHSEKDFEGTGVGLATVRRILQKHGGRIWVESELDKGTTFYFTLAGLQALPEHQPAIQEAV
jgi:PAS domain S-box-containing protein